MKPLYIVLGLLAVGAVVWILWGNPLRMLGAAHADGGAAPAPIATPPTYQDGRPLNLATRDDLRASIAPGAPHYS
jgi:hypothetical protein